MNKLQQQVRRMHKIFGQHHGPAEPKLRNPIRRARLIAEEAIETVCALVGGAEGQTVVHEMLVKVLQDRAKKKMEGPNLLEAIDGCGDTLVVVYGTLEDIGVDGEPFTDEIMRSNFDKEGGPIDAFGKVGKPPGWRDADLAGVLEHHDHGRGDDSGPHDPDCPCRGGDEQTKCAQFGCGFCSAAA